MKNKYLKTMKECQNNLESNTDSVIEKVFSNEMILESIYKLQLDLSEYISKQDLYNNKAEVTAQEINRLEQQLN